MVLDDRHIAYLEEVAAGNIRLWWGPKKITSRYVSADWANGRKNVDQTVAAQMKALGMTRISHVLGTMRVVLTEKGEAVLEEEKEAWA